MATRNQRKWIFAAGLAVVLFASGLWLKQGLFFDKRGAAPEASREPSFSSELPPPELGEIWGPEQEATAQEIVRSSIETARKNAVNGQTFRDAHPKHHGCVKARWSVEVSELPNELRLGPFAPQSEFEAWVRFSNGSPGGKNAPDSDTDVRGMAVKLMNVPGAAGGSQDFVMITSPRFFSRDAEDYVELHRAIEGGAIGLASYLVFNPSNAWIINKARVTGHNPMEFNYFSAVPYKLGSLPMRYKVAPCSGQEAPLSADERNPNYMASALAATLRERPFCFDVFVQTNRDTARNPVEDPRRFWDEHQDPYLLAARLTLDKQTGLHTSEMSALCENLSFNPWHTLPEIRPMGQINRIRKSVYDAVSKFRHDSNGRPQIEPVDHSPCENAQTAALCRTAN